MAQRSSLGYARLLGTGRARGAVDVAALLDPRDAADLDVTALKAGAVVKLKVGDATPAQDARRVDLLDWRGCVVRVDANRKWDADQYAAFLDALDMDPAKLDFVEEPPPVETQATAANAPPYALDESIKEARDAGDAWRPAFDDADALVLKAALLGVGASAALATRAARPVVSSCFESGVGLAHLACFAAALRREDAHGLGTFAWLKDDPLEPSFASLLDADLKLDVPSAERALRDAATRVLGT